MSIPVVPEHEKDCNEECFGMDEAPKGGCSKCRFNKCIPDCPACAVEANNKAWAKYLDGLVREVLTFSLKPISQCIAVRIPASDWEQIKKLAEEG